jgi:glycerol-1-phosphate dehydrogenase [NAD(P)+]
MSNTTQIIRAKHLVKNLCPLLSEHKALALPILFVCDTNSYHAAAQALTHSFKAADYTVVNLGLQVSATLKNAQKIGDELADYPTICCVGSGTLSDLCKYAAHQNNKALITIPSAASMNGYASPTASLMDADGHKQSLAAKAPDLILLDTDIYAQAPIRLQLAGLGDTLCRSSVQLDALLSHHLSGSWYDADYFNKLTMIEKELIAHAEKLKQHDSALCEMLMDALILSGQAMAKAGSSAPASQGEHMIAHKLEQAFPALMKQRLHGAHIAITSVTMLRLQLFMIQKPLQLHRAEYAQAMGRIPHSDGVQKKADMLAGLDIKIYQKTWGVLQQQIAENTLDTNEVELALSKAGLATEPQALGITHAEYSAVVSAAFASRDRITFLDMAAMR